MPSLRHLSLKAKAAVFISAILVLVISLSTGMMIMTVVPRLRSFLLTSTTLLGENLIKDVKKTVDLGVSLSQLDLSKNLDDLVQSNADLGYVFITDAGDKVLYQSQGMDIASVRETAKGSFARVDASSAARDSLVEIGGLSFYDIGLPIAAGGSLAGAVHLGLKSQVVRSQINAILLRSLAIGALSFMAATTLIILFVNRSISRPLEELSRTAEQISDGRLISPPTGTRKDEIGQLASAFQVMVQGLSSVISSSMDTSGSLSRSSVELASVAQGLTGAFDKQLSTLAGVTRSMSEMDKISHNLMEQARKLSDSAAESSSSTLELTSAIGEINRNMSEITAAVENISTAIVEMSTTVKQVASGAEKTASMAEETKEAIGKINSGIRNMETLVEKFRGLSENLRKNALDIGSRSVRETLKGILSIKEDVQHSEDAMKSLQQRVENIGEIVTVIDEIADQTNLLALNASIISAQAGEHGRAFAVVASEIRELSVRTSDSTKKISALIRAVQEESANYATYLGRVIGSVGKGLSLGQEAEKALEKIITAADESSQMANLIAQVTKEQAAASDKVSQSVLIFTRGAEEIKKATSEEAKGSFFIKEAMEKAKEMVDMVYKATGEQSRGSGLMAQTSERAKEVASQLMMATELERRLSDNVSTAIEELKKITTENGELIRKINVSSGMMTDLAGSLKKDLGRFQLDEARKPAAREPAKREKA